MKRNHLITIAILIFLIGAWATFYKLNYNNKKIISDTPTVEDKSDKNKGTNYGKVEDIRPKDIKEPKDKQEVNNTNVIQRHQLKYLEANDDAMQRMGLFIGKIDLTDVCDQIYVDQFVGYQKEISANIKWYESKIYSGNETYANQEAFQVMIELYKEIESKVSDLIVYLNNQDIVNGIETLKDIQTLNSNLEAVKGVVNRD